MGGLKRDPCRTTKIFIRIIPEVNDEEISLSHIPVSYLEDAGHRPRSHSII